MVWVVNSMIKGISETHNGVLDTRRCSLACNLYNVFDPFKVGLKWICRNPNNFHVPLHKFGQSSFRPSIPPPMIIVISPKIFANSRIEWGISRRKNVPLGNLCEFCGTNRCEVSRMREEHDLVMQKNFGSSGIGQQWDFAIYIGPGQNVGPSLRTQELPAHSWNRMIPSVESASKSGAILPSRNDGIWQA